MAKATAGKVAKRVKATGLKADNLFTLGLLARVIPAEEWQSYFSLWRFGGSLEAQVKLGTIVRSRLKTLG
ncbi:hypothetical protein ES708_31711 [subsurface metagenome]